MQGIRIRFGRSVITITGVVLGIAFLMSILSGQALRKGVQQEDELRQSVGRMMSFLAAEMGPPEARTVGVVLAGELSEAEQRLLRRLEKNDLGRLQWTGLNQQRLPSLFSSLSPVMLPVEEVGDDASAVLFMGGRDPSSVPWQDALEGARQQVIGFTRRGISMPDLQGMSVVKLARELREEEARRLEREEKKARYRNLWITIISLLVTVMGISNAMLMSVTERFREIGTMKCLGALSSFVRTMFLIESGFMGILGGLAGCIIGVLFSVVAYGFTYGFGLMTLSLQTEIGGLFVYMFMALLAGVMLSVIAAIYPAHVASTMVPADALRTNV